MSWIYLKSILSASSITKNDSLLFFHSDAVAYLRNLCKTITLGCTMDNSFVWCESVLAASYVSLILSFQWRWSPVSQTGFNNASEDNGVAVWMSGCIIWSCFLFCETIICHDRYLRRRLARNGRLFVQYMFLLCLVWHVIPSWWWMRLRS